jgi:hypothetical protein
MMKSCRSGVFLPMKNAEQLVAVVEVIQVHGLSRMFSPMKSLNSPAEISPRPLKRVIS